ncbi:MAG TPA: hypothetical protein VHY22_00520 [Chthoniobacteraceae bacterium]|nr:hypothetical protein [Chthoniobacteraceae bacterium]
MKTLLLCFLLPWCAGAQENAYDVLGKALMPVANVFVTGTATHGLVLDAHLLQASALPPALQNQPIHLALMPPGQALVQAPIDGQVLTVCRNGDSLWAAPASKIQPLLDALAAHAAGKKKRKHADSAAAKVFGPLALPIPPRDLVFLPVLFDVADVGNDTVAGATCRVLDVRFMPQIEKSLHAENWIARLWIKPDYSIVQIGLKGPNWSGGAAIDKMDFPGTLPAAAFQAPPADVMRLTAAQFLDLLQRLGR